MSNEIRPHVMQEFVRCPHCGSFAASSQEGTCPVCGGHVREATARTDPMYDFHQTLATLTPRVLATPAIVISNVAIFVVMAATGVNVFTPNPQSVLDWGANFGPRTMNGEWWRLVTSMFLHFGIIHLGFNMWVLWDLGRFVERLVGNVGFLVLYLTSGIAGSLASLMWHSNIISAGASGAVFGVAGALLGFIALRRDTVPPSMRNHLRNSMLGFLVLNLVIGYSIPQIDMAAHVGGFIAGLACGLILSQPLNEGARARRIVRNSALAVISTFSLIGAANALPAAPPDVNAELKHFYDEQDRVFKDFQALHHRWQEREMSNAEFADSLERDILPPWVELRERLEKLIDADTDIRPLVTQLASYMKARGESWQLLAEAARFDDARKKEQSDKRERQAAEIVEELNRQQSNAQ